MKIMVYYIATSRFACDKVIAAKKSELQAEFPYLKIMVLANHEDNNDRIEVLDFTIPYAPLPTVVTTGPNIPYPNWQIGPCGVAGTAGGGGGQFK